MNNLELIGKQVFDNIISQLNNCGLFYRAFYRIKTTNSLIEKINKKKYHENKKKLQDSIGIRLVLYFKDDIDFVKKMLLKNNYLIDRTIDNPQNNQFSAQRFNFILGLPDSLLQDFATALFADLSNIFRHNTYTSEEIKSLVEVIDKTYEVQIRTVFSEGWHEVEHDLKYKCQEEWENYDDLSRVLNGIYATLDTSDWAILNLFKELAYRNYKDKKWAPMLRNKLRLRFNSISILSKEIELHLNNFPSFAKEIYKVERSEFIERLERLQDIPVTLDNAVYIANYYFIKDKEIMKITPQAFIEIANSV